MAAKVIKGQAFGWLEVGELIDGVTKYDKNEEYAVEAVREIDLTSSFSSSAWRRKNQGEQSGLVSSLIGYPDSFHTISRLNDWIRSNWDFGQRRLYLNLGDLSSQIIALSGPRNELRYNGDFISRYVYVGLLDKAPPYKTSFRRTKKAVRDTPGIAIAVFGLSTGNNTPVVRTLSTGGWYEDASVNDAKSGFGSSVGISFELVQLRSGNFVNNSQMSHLSEQINHLGRMFQGGKADGNT